MEQVIDVINSVSKIGLIAFLIIFVILIYELILINKERIKKSRPNIPNFNPDTKTEIGMTPLPLEKMETNVYDTKINKVIIIILFPILIILGGLIFSGIFKGDSNKDADNQPKIIINEVNSKGIKLFTLNWREISGKKIATDSSKIIVGVETIPDTDTDKARIRINESQWRTEHITLQFNTQYKVFYREYEIATDSQKLKIEAQLHSKIDGWLGD